MALTIVKPGVIQGIPELSKDCPTAVAGRPQDCLIARTSTSDHQCDTIHAMSLLLRVFVFS